MRNKTISRLLAVSMSLVFALTSAVTAPIVASAAPTNSVIVKTQKQLNAALKDKAVNEVVLKTNKSVAVKISIGDYSDKTLTIASPKATINNYGDFKKITLKDGKSFTDRGVGNIIVVKDNNSSKIVTGKQSVGAKITVWARTSKLTVVNNGEADSINIKTAETVVVRGIAKEAPAITVNAEGANLTTAMDANVVLNKSATLTVVDGAELGSLKVNANADITVAEGASVAKVAVAQNASEVNLVADGSIGSVTMDAKASLSVTGDTKSAVAITSNVEGASISSSVKTNVTLNAEAKISLGKGAEGSSVKAGNGNVTPTVENKTDSAVTVTDSKGQDATVGAGQSGSGEPVKNTESQPDSGSGDTGGTESTGGSSNPGSSDTGNTNPDSSDSGSTDTGSSGTGNTNPDGSGTGGMDTGANNPIEEVVPAER